MLNCKGKKIRIFSHFFLIAEKGTSNQNSCSAKSKEKGKGTLWCSSIAQLTFGFVLRHHTSQSHLNTNSQTLPFGKGVVLPKMSTGKYCKRKTLLITTCHLDITNLRCKKAVPEEKYDKGVHGHLLGDDVHALVEQYGD